MNMAILIVSIVTAHNGNLNTDTFKTDPIPGFKCYIMKDDLGGKLDKMNESNEIVGYAIECK
jgi:hypothetical protein